ncbi:hypothetical protein J6590_066976, partial [Homalodisca vitripennis]
MEGVGQNDRHATDDGLNQIMKRTHASLRGNVLNVTAQSRLNVHAPTSAPRLSTDGG